MLENLPSYHSLLDFNHFVGDQTSNATSIPYPDYSNPSSTIFSAGSPSSSSFATSVGCIPDTTVMLARNNSVSSQAVGDVEPTSISQLDSRSLNYSSRQSDWTGDQQWLGNEVDVHHTTTPQSTGVNMAAWVATVAEVNTRLFKRAEQIPGVDNPGQTPHQEKVFAVDQIFLLSQQLIDLLNQVYPCFTNGQTRTPVSSESSPCSLNGRDIAPPNPPPPCAPTIKLDPGSMLLVLSCHLRLLEIHEKIFFHIERWIRDRNSPNPPADIHFPGLNIGAFSLNNSSGLQITLVIQLVEQLLGRLRDITLLMDTTAIAMGTKAETGREASANPFTSLSEVGDVALQAVKSRESDTIKNISRVKRLLQNSGIM